ncbi:Mu-like prophage major head subunit gpT family protein [Desulfobulbus elongatus]|uniref:Mu-like prophage major head subunit gpT family protein n=1 Tax=Desulfobulbus elongatus TaxID=53332 RepID=UPI000489CB13|nr:Mu-like prophage major head subunit gpT family protein [Desulfobulbus elongatus]
MIINASNIASATRAFKATFQRGFDSVQPMYGQVATTVPSSTLIEDYGWLGQIPGMREWLGDRVIHNLSQHDYSIKNKSFELTVGVDRERYEDDQYGIFAPLMENLGYESRIHPDKLVFGLMAAGFATACYDGQYFFDSDHPVLDKDGNATSVSNVQAGAGNPWFLLDTKRPLKPIIFQDRKRPNFVLLNKEDDQNVVMSKKFLYGVDSRCNVGFGFWQMAYGSKAELSAANFNAAYDAMGALKKDYGEPLGISPNLLVVGPSNYSKARTILEAQLVNGGDSNINYKMVDLLKVPWLA